MKAKESTLIVTPDTCTKCGVGLPNGSAHCPHCGARRNYVLPAAPGVFRFQGYAPSVIVSGSDPQTGGEYIRVDAPGASSETHFTLTGGVSLRVKGAGGIGRQGEPQLLKVLRTKLQQRALTPSVASGRDNRGEDAILRTGDSTLVVQIVTAPADTVFWREAHAGSIGRQAYLPEAVQWRRAAIERKAAGIAPRDRPGILLAIDARHAGVLAARRVVDGYMARFGDPAAEYGFTSVWIVGPTADYCTRLGEGVP